MATPHFYKVVPSLPVKDLQFTIDFYCNILGFSEPWTYGNPATDGGCRRNDLRMIFTVNQQMADKCIGQDIIFFVTGVDDIYNEMIEKNIPVISPIKTYDYGIREFSIRDCNGYNIRVATGIEFL